MISAPGCQNVIKWIAFCSLAFASIAVISVISPLEYSKYETGIILEQISATADIVFNAAPINFTKSTIRQHSSLDTNPHPFGFLLLEPNLCSNLNKSNGINVITVVHSAPRHFKSRDFIRRTWGDRLRHPENRVLFILGVDNASSTQRLILEESRQHGDIIQEDFMDTYHNLTYKAVAWLKYISQYCTNVDFVLKVDDDVVVNMKHVGKFLRMHHAAGDRRTIYCLIWYNLTVQREPSNRWRLTKEDYENDNFPDYCSGSAYLITNDIINPLYKQSFHVPFLWIDDIYVTGLLVKRYNDRQSEQKHRIKHYDLSARYVLSKKLLADQFLQQFAMFAHVPGSVNARHWYWDEMHKKRKFAAPPFGQIADAAIRIT